MSLIIHVVDAVLESDSWGGETKTEHVLGVHDDVSIENGQFQCRLKVRGAGGFGKRRFAAHEFEERAHLSSSVGVVTTSRRGGCGFVASSL